MPGDVLALVEGEVHLIGTDLADTCAAWSTGCSAAAASWSPCSPARTPRPGSADAVRAHVARRWPFVEVQAYPGGQPHYPLLVGVE